MELKCYGNDIDNSKPLIITSNNYYKWGIVMTCKFNKIGQNTNDHFRYFTISIENPITIVHHDIIIIIKCISNHTNLTQDKPTHLNILIKNLDTSSNINIFDKNIELLISNSIDQNHNKIWFDPPNISHITLPIYSTHNTTDNIIQDDNEILISYQNTNIYLQFNNFEFF